MKPEKKPVQEERRLGGAEELGHGLESRFLNLPVLSSGLKQQQAAHLGSHLSLWPLLVSNGQLLGLGQENSVAAAAPGRRRLSCR